MSQFQKTQRVDSKESLSRQEENQHEKLSGPGSDRQAILETLKIDPHNKDVTNQAVINALYKHYGRDYGRMYNGAQKELGLDVETLVRDRKAIFIKPEVASEFQDFLKKANLTENSTKQELINALYARYGNTDYTTYVKSRRDFGINIDDLTKDRKGLLGNLAAGSGKTENEPENNITADIEDPFKEDPHTIEKIDEEVSEENDLVPEITETTPDEDDTLEEVPDHDGTPEETTPAEPAVPDKSETVTPSPPHVEPGPVPDTVKQQPELPPKQKEYVEPPVSEERMLEIERKVQEAHLAMNGGMTGWGTDEERLLNALKGLNPKEAAILKNSYKERFGIDLQQEVESELSGDDLEQAKASLASDKISAAVYNLHEAMDGAGTDEDRIMQQLGELDRNEADQVIQAYEKKYGRSLHQDLKEELDSDLYGKAESLLRGDKIQADAYKLHEALDGAGTDEEAVKEVLGRYSGQELESLKGKYSQLFGRELNEDLADDLSDNDFREAAHQLSDDKTGAIASRLHSAMDGAGTDEEAIFKELESIPESERAEVERRYQEISGRSLGDALESELSGTDLEKAKVLLQHGKLSDAEKLHFAVEGAGTDEDAIREILKDKTAEEIENISLEYQQKYNESLHERLSSELGGSDRFRASQALLGKAETLDEQLRRAEELNKFERSGVMSGLVGAFTDEDERIDRSLEKARKALDAAKKDGALSEAEKKEVEKLIRNSNNDIEVHVETRDAIADTAATTASVVAATAVVVGTGGTATPLVAALAAGYGGAAYTLTKVAIKGNSYDTQDLGSDVGIGAAEGLITAGTAGAGKAVKEALVQGAKASTRVIARTAAHETAVETVGGTVQDALRPDTWKGGAASGLANLAASAAVGAVANGTFKGVDFIPHAHVAPDAVAKAEDLVDDVAPTVKLEQPPVHESVRTSPQNPNTSSSIPDMYEGKNPFDWATDAAKKVDQKVGNIPEHLHEHRLGIPGKLRSAAELSNENVADVLNAQLNKISKEDVESIIKSFPLEQQALATKALDMMSRSGSIDSLGELASFLDKNVGAGRLLYSEKNGSLADAVSYLATNKKLFGYIQDFEVSSEIKPGMCAILDNSLIARIKRDPEFAQSLIDNKVTLINPLSVNGAMSPFDSPSLQDIKGRLRALVNRAAEINPGNTADPEALVRQAMEMQSKLEGLNPKLLKQVKTMEFSPQQADDITERILRQVNGSTGISELDIEKQLGKFDAVWHPLIREMIVQNSEVHSHRSMAALARKQCSNIMEYAEKSGVEPENVIFVVTDSKRSFGIYNYLFKEANQGTVSPQQFVNMKDLKKTLDSKHPAKSIIVGLDDFAGSGDSLLSADKFRGRIRGEVGSETEIVLAPMISTNEAFKMLAAKRQGDPNVTIIPGRVILGFEESNVAQGGFKDLADEVIGAKGYSGSGTKSVATCVSLPYMGPDNNCSLFGSQYFNPYFIVNRVETAVKSSGIISKGDAVKMFPVIKQNLEEIDEILSKSEISSIKQATTLGDRLSEISEHLKSIDKLSETQDLMQSALGKLDKKVQALLASELDYLEGQGLKELSYKEFINKVYDAGTLAYNLQIDDFEDRLKKLVEISAVDFAARQV